MQDAPISSAAYRSMAQDEKRECEALEWVEALIADCIVEHQKSDNDRTNPREEQ
jgi:hypothetical protein